MSYLTYDIGIKRVSIKEPTWPQIADALSALNADISDPHRRGLIYSGYQAMFSVASMITNPDRLLVRLHINNRPIYHILDPTLVPNEDDASYVTVRDAEVEDVLIHETIPKEEASRILYEFYHEHKLPPEERWIRAL